MTLFERRQELLELLCRRRCETYSNLAREFNVSKMTIRRDILVLMCSYPIETVHGGRHGGVRVPEWFVLDHCNTSQNALSPKQLDLLRKLSIQLTGDERDTINSIIAQFSP